MATVYISFNAKINLFTTQNLLAATFDQLQKGATHIYYLFASPGGEVAQGMTLYNIIKGLPVKTTMHNVGNVDSIGNAIFLAGKRRKASPHSTFMFHGVGFDLTNPTRLEEKTLRECLGTIDADHKRIGSVISQETALKGTKVNRLFRQAETKDATYALDSGIIHSIEDVNLPAGAPLIQLVFQG
jgi:ATP-dependent protease ClpP protease subunit